MKIISTAVAFSILFTPVFLDGAWAKTKNDKLVGKQPSILERLFKPSSKKKAKKRSVSKKKSKYIVYGDESRKKKYKPKKVAYKKPKSARRPTRDILRYVKSSSAQRIEARIDLSEQRMNVYKGGVKIHTWPVSTGRSGFGTPSGSFKPYRMHNMWYSTKYEWAPMPHAIFFRGGFAIHATNSIKRLGRRASHGCVRLHPSNAATLFKMVRQNGANNTSIKIVQ